MNTKDNFTFISPIPYPIKPAELLDSQLRLDNFTAKECVEFFWRVNRVYISANLSIYYKGEGYDIPLYDETDSTYLDSINSNSAFGVAMRERPNFRNVCNIANEKSYFEIRGPYTSNNYSSDVDFSLRTFEYHLGFYFGVGNITISSVYIPNTENPDAMITAKRFPFEIFGRIYYLNLNVPKTLLNPKEYGLIASFSGNAQVNFEFL